MRVLVTDSARPDDLVTRVKSRFPHALVIHHEPPERARATTSAVVAAGADPLEVCGQFVRYVRGGDTTEAENQVLRDALERVNAQEVSA